MVEIKSGSFLWAIHSASEKNENETFANAMFSFRPLLWVYFL